MQTEIPSQWGILELMGRKVVAGYISNIDKPLVRIDVPQTETFEAFTQFYGTGAIYGITFTSEEVARKAANDYRVNPISVYAPSLVDRSELEKERELSERLRGMLRDEQKKLPASEVCLNTGRLKSECTCDDCVPF